ncbi:class I SAM-dependent methyltransferase [Flammeovirga kamogawensis]|uniref:Methyltransferase domain-containing protein n=1 Tax=Flammeovirga kamogawensis TaxID=373891 RepID=A0ABX8H0A8_9BACT|nr:methyltransferase domain-containing protein [Flammeovirga kamogawensis]MBB6459359.1 2-polyprenyl-3-methyl-5-hydroxy-6-metoxy-1,4-benzoquinol methylase [Flammeovirga kamogawensis]QWG08916.1 methyltransferase domain-containing protein [Flammeovirga kamogawensis]
MEINKVEGWNTFYKSPNAFGKPYPELIHFLKNIQSKKNLLDLGAGQGRTALIAAEIGFKVTAVDYSAEGISIIKNTYANIATEVADIFEYEISQSYQIILLDAVIHCQQEDLEKESQLFNSIENNLQNNGFLLLITHQWDMREDHLIKLFEKKYKSLQFQFNSHIDHLFIPPNQTEESCMEMSFMCFKKININE